jgi:hypothetical protein
MISPKLIFQCSSVSLLTAAVLASPVWIPSSTSTDAPSNDPSSQTHQVERLEVEPTRIQPVLRSADAPTPTDRRSIEERNRAANQMLGELENTLEFRDSPQAAEALVLRKMVEESQSRVIRCSRKDMRSMDIIRDD